MTTTTQQIPPLDSFHDLIWKHANYCWQRLPDPKTLDLDDLFQEGALCYMTTQEKYRPTRGKFITLFYLRLQQHFAGILKRSYRDRRAWPMEEAALGMVANPREPVQPRWRLGQMLESTVSRPAWRLARALMDPPRALRERIRENPRRVRTLIYESLGITAVQGRRLMVELRVAAGRKTA